MSYPEIRTSTESAQLIADYFRENGRMPTQHASQSGEQKRLALALIRLRRLQRQGKLPDAAHRILDEAHPAWTARASLDTDKLWQARVDVLIAWINQHGRTPHRTAADPTERSLAEWVDTYSSHALHGRHPDRIKELDARLPSWRQRQSRSRIRPYSESAQLIADYFRENGRMPPLEPQSGDQKRLASTLARLRRLKRQGKLPEAANQILDQANPGWMDGSGIRSDKLWQTRVDELVAWAGQHGRTPHWSAADPTERALAHWLTRYRTHARTGRHPDRIKDLNARLPTWHQSPSSEPKRRAGREVPGRNDRG